MTATAKRAKVPKLRFFEFRDAGEWEEKSLRETCDRILDKVGSAKLTTVSITAGFGFVAQADKFGRDISGEQYKNYIHLKYGDFAYNKGNSKKYPQGYVCQLKEFEQAAASSAFICFRLQKEYKAKFLQGLFDQNVHGRQLSKFITSGARSDGLLNIRPEDFFGIKVPVPLQFEEQQKIADCLSAIDELITLETQKLDTLKTHKKGLMQELFPAEGETLPKLRFPEFREAGEWEEKTLSQVCKLNPPANSLPETFVYIDLESVEAGILLQKKMISREGAPSRAQRLLKEGDVIFQLVRPYQKNNYFFQPNDDLDYVASTGYAQLRARESNAYLFQYLHNDRFVNKVLEKCTGSNYPAINSSDLSNILIEIPKEDEQQKIADCLSSIDELITAQVQKLDTLKTHKKGLMQQLFPALDEGQG